MYRDKSPKRIIESFLFVSHLYKITPSKLSKFKYNAKKMNFKHIFFFINNLFFQMKALLLVEYLKGSEMKLRKFTNVSIVFINSLINSVLYKTAVRDKNQFSERNNTKIFSMKIRLFYCDILCYK